MGHCSRLIFFFLLGFAIRAQSQIQFSIEKGKATSEVVLSGKVGYGLVLSPIQAYKKNLQNRVGEIFNCGAPGSFKCDEYPFGQIMGEKKFLMKEESKDVWNHPVVEYIDKKQSRSLMVPLEIARDFPVATVGDFQLLNPNAPGNAVRPFEVLRKSLGESLVKIVPDGNVLYVHVCQILPGTSLLNNQISGTYTYLHKKVFGKKISLSADFEGHLGGAAFDAVKICSLMKTELKNNYAVSSVIDVLPPVTYNMHRVPLKIKIASASWVLLVIIGIIIGAILLFLPGAIFKILAVLSILMATVIGVLGSMSSKFVTKYANQQVDKVFEQYTGVKVDDFNSEVWAKKLKYDELPFFKEEQVTEGEFKDGSWAMSFLTKKLMKDHQLLAQVSVELALDKYLEQYALPSAEALRPTCEQMAKRVIERANGLKLTDKQSASVADTAKRIADICSKIHVNAKAQMFIPLGHSRRAGCYDSFIRLEEIQDGKSQVQTSLLDKLRIGPGGPKRFAVKDAVEKRLTEVSVVQASNWWARQDSDSYCGFDNRITINYSLPEESRFVGCFIKELKGDRLGLQGLVDRVIDRCNLEIRELSGVKK